MAFDGAAAEPAVRRRSGRSPTRCSSRTPASTRRRRSSPCSRRTGRRRREAAARVQGRPPVERDRQPARPGRRRRAFTYAGRSGARHVSARLAPGPSPTARRRSRAAGAGSSRRPTTRGRRPRRRALVPAQPDARLCGAGGPALGGAARQRLATWRPSSSRAPATVTSPDRDGVRRLLRTLAPAARGRGDARVAWDGTTDGGAVVYSRPVRRRGDGDERARRGHARTRPSSVRRVCAAAAEEAAGEAAVASPRCSPRSRAQHHLRRRRPRALRRLRADADRRGASRRRASS